MGSNNDLEASNAQICYSCQYRSMGLLEEVIASFIPEGGVAS